MSTPPGLSRPGALRPHAQRLPSACPRPLQVGGVYDHHNIWANVQLSGAPWDIDWHLMDARFWRPFFGLMVGAPALHDCLIYHTSSCIWGRKGFRDQGFFGLMVGAPPLCLCLPYYARVA